MHLWNEILPVPTKKKERKKNVGSSGVVEMHRPSSHLGSYQDFDTHEFSHSYLKKISLLTTFATALFLKCCLRG